MEMCTFWLLEVLCILSTLMIVNTSVNTSRQPNIKITTQSSNHSAAYISGNVVDGCRKQIFDKDNCCSHTALGQLEAWWQVDLEGLIVMEYVKIYYRDQTYQNKKRFGGYQIYQSNTSDWRYGYLCHKDTTSTSAALSLTPQINCTGTAKYLTIYSDRRSGGLWWYSSDAFLELCEVEVYGCPLGKYGDGNCDSDCGVGCGDSLCDPVTERCAYCEDGFFGSFCDNCSVGCSNHICDKVSGNCDPCLNGLYGMKCDQLCSSRCENNICTQYKGNCTACTAGYYGDTCNKSCPSNCKGDTCNQTSGLCTDCEDGFFGLSCDKCSVGCTNHVCDKISGICSSCLNSLYGMKCDLLCSPNCESSTCTQYEGICTACRPGYYGDTCYTSCPSKCKGDLCNQASGLCTECGEGLYGTDCNQSCPDNCQDNSCHRRSGECEVCVTGFYGSQCLKSCGKCQGVSCDMATGECTSGCTDGWTGTKCDAKVVIVTKCDAAVGIGIGSGVVILALVIVIIVLIRRLTMKQSDTTDSSHMTDMSLSRTAISLKKDQENTYDEIASCNKEQPFQQISHKEANYEQLGRREVEIPHTYETTDVDKKT